MKTATVEHNVTDQGNGAAYCGGCGIHLTSDPLQVPTVCPKCGAVFTYSRYYSQSGRSDF
jgi:predicted RNA-binding Zn-ribbon protein involved in translation (DUF1610 family)